MNRIFLLLSIVVLAIGLSACSNNDSLEQVGLNGLNGKEILTGIAEGTVEVDGYGISVYDDELLVILDNDKISVEMPKDEFYLSVAPYIDMTHECLYHSATGCRGEMKSEMFFVEFVDHKGTVILSENMTSLSNGFIDLWLPRDIEGTLTITYGDLSTSKVISTTSGQPTCETTMQLS